MIAEPAETLEGGFSRRVLRWVVGIAVASFCAALVLSGIGEDLESRETAGASSFSYSAIGHRALVEMLSALGLGVVSRRSQGGGSLGPRTPLVLAEPALEDGPPELRERITAARNEAGKAQAVLVLVLPKWRGEPGDRMPGWVGAVGLRPEEETTAVLENLGEGELAELRIVRSGAAERRTCTARGAEGPRSFTFDADFPQLAAASAALTPVVTCNGLLLVGRRKLLPPGPEVLVITDPDVLNNQGLGRGDHAALMEWIFVQELEARGALFDETIHGFSRSRGLLAEAFRFPLLPATLQALLLTGIVLWAGMGRIGKPLPAPRALAAGKDVLIDNTATLLTSGGHVADSLARYHRQTVQAVVAALFLPADLPAATLQRRLQEVSENRGIRIDLAAIERQMKALDDGRDAAARALDIARRLHRWRREMTHGQRNS